MRYEEVYGKEKQKMKQKNTQKTSRLKQQKALKAKKRKRRRAILFTFEALVLIALVVGVFFLSKWDKVQKAEFQAADIQVNDNIDPDVLEKMQTGYTMFYVFGVDATNNDTLKSGTRADVDMIVCIDNATGSVKVVSVYRDTFLQRADTGGYSKITEAYAKGADNSISTLNINLDLNITKFVTVNWKAVAETIDLLGGVELTIEEELLSLTEHNLNGYIEDICKATGLESDYIYSPGTYVCSGVQAVAYARMRYATVPGFSIGDYGRSERQRIVIQLMLEKAKQADLLTLNSIADQILPQVYTNFEASEVLAMLQLIGNFSMDETMGFPVDKVSDTIGSYGSIVIPTTLESNVIQLHDYLFGGTGAYSPSDTVKNISNEIINITGYQ